MYTCCMFLCDFYGFPKKNDINIGVLGDFKMDKIFSYLKPKIKRNRKVV